jgi:hypothetical protein
LQALNLSLETQSPLTVETLHRRRLARVRRFLRLRLQCWERVQTLRIT